MSNRRKNEIRWVVDGEQIILGHQQIYTTKSLLMRVILLKCIGAMIAILVGSNLIFENPLVNTAGLLIGAALYLYGSQVNKARRDAVTEMERRAEEIKQAHQMEK